MHCMSDKCKFFGFEPKNSQEARVKEVLILCIKV
jgi:hypothetical protein